MGVELRQGEARLATLSPTMPNQIIQFGPEDRRCAVWFAGLVMLVALAITPAQVHAMGLADDPLEAVNRAVFDLNQFFAKPVRRLSAKIKRTVDPTVIQALRDFLDNIAEPSVAASYLAEGEVSQMRLALRRLILNTVEGPLGFRDVAAAEGLRQRSASLTDVLCHYGVPPGPYVMLPFYGGMTLRDLVAQVATISTGYVVLGEIYLGYRIASLTLGTLDQPSAIQQVQFLHNGRPDPYGATRAWHRLAAHTQCDSRGRN
jgi:ABC-type transporter lipoprotein component MlaA